MTLRKFLKKWLKKHLTPFRAFLLGFFVSPFILYLLFELYCYALTAYILWMCAHHGGC